jgi:predicted RNA-binding Zn-ribbon protein involved in translation (DUF1610 family)
MFAPIRSVESRIKKVMLAGLAILGIAAALKAALPIPGIEEAFRLWVTRALALGIAMTVLVGWPIALSRWGINLRSMFKCTSCGGTDVVRNRRDLRFFRCRDCGRRWMMLDAFGRSQRDASGPEFDAEFRPRRDGCWEGMGPTVVDDSTTGRLLRQKRDEPPRPTGRPILDRPGGAKPEKCEPWSDETTWERLLRIKRSVRPRRDRSDRSQLPGPPTLWDPELDGGPRRSSAATAPRASSPGPTRGRR